MHLPLALINHVTLPLLDLCVHVHLLYIYRGAFDICR